MRIKLGYLASILGAAAIAAAISAAPIASAAPGTHAQGQHQQSCAASGPGTLCQSPGNAQINDAPPPAEFYPYGGQAFLL
ncbi:MAG: hypothetical protein QOD39_4269 [Mycobacterium sp.]|jgi:hypothetical protein|nr:hypothetical protein [Mycobacterium sp.]